MLKYNKESLDKISNPELVNCFLTVEDDNRRRYLAATLVNGQFVQLTEPRHRIMYPFEPINDIYKILGSRYMSNFISLYDNEHAVNRNNITGFKFYVNEDKYVDVIASFLEGHATTLYKIKDKYLKKEELMLNILLGKNINDNNKDYFKNLDHTELAKTYNFLNDTITSLFPESGAWSSSEFDKKGLLGNLRNREYMVSYLGKKLANSKQSIPDDYIRYFMDHSKKYEEARHEYELKVVNWQINYMRNGGEGWLLPEGADDMCMYFSPNCDNEFRAGIVKTLGATGMDLEVIEEGIETFADSWRDWAMERAFMNKYDPIFSCAHSSSFPEVDLEFKEAWMKLRKHDYYEKHWSSVTNNASMSDEITTMSLNDIQELRSYCAVKGKEREKQMEEAEKVIRYSPTINLDNE